MSNKNCGCGFGHSKKNHFGNGADSFFFPLNESNANLNVVKKCLNNGIYGSSVPLTRFGVTNTKQLYGPMKIGKTKK